MRRLTKEEFIDRSKKKHGDKYDYSKVEYINNHSKVIIECPIHGDFKQPPAAHIHEKSGCPKCNSSKGEVKILMILEKNKIVNIPQYKIFYSKIKKKMFIDFYIPNFNGEKYAIEYNGEQHYEYVPTFHKGNSTLEKQQQRDADLRDYCHLNNIILIEIPYWDYDNIETILNKSFKNEI